MAVAALWLAGAVGPSPRLLAHDVPADVTIHAFLRTEMSRLQLLVRVPLAAMRDVDVPIRAGTPFLDLSRAEPALRDAATIWITQAAELFEEDRAIGPATITAARVSLPADESFRTFGTALAHVTGPPLPTDTELVWEQGLLDVLVEYPLTLEEPRLSLRPGLDRLGLRVTTNLRWVLPDGTERVFQFHQDPGLVRLDPRWHQAVWRFARNGFGHILDGIDHLLFLLCLVIPFRRLRSLVVIVTGFTIAHSITLIASAYGLAPDALWFPPLVETLIAASIVYMGLENIVDAWPWGTRAPRVPDVPRRWAITFAFGLIHGFGFSFALRDSLQLAGSHLVTSLLAFNLGVEIGQIAVLLVAVPVLAVVFRRVVAESVGVIILSALVVHTGWHWMIERGATLGQYQFQWPALGWPLVAVGLRWAMLAVLVGAVAWLALGVLRVGRESVGPADESA